MKRELLIVYGGKSCEHDISIITALYIYHAINIKEYNKKLIYLNQGNFYAGNGLEEIENYLNFDSNKYKKVSFSNGKLFEVSKKLKNICKVDCVLLCTHGGQGENGALQGFFEINNIPYTSSGVFSSSLAMDKVMTKKMLESMNYNVVPYTVIKKEDFFDTDNIEKSVKYPMIIKPALLGSSIGISVANNKEQAIKGVRLGFEYDTKLLVEKCLQNFTEINCAAVKNGNQVIVSLPERPIITSGFLSYEDKYLKNTKLQTDREYPAKIDVELTSKIQNLTRQVYTDFEMKGVVRIDYLVENEQNIYVNEINTIPGSLSHYLFTKLGINTSQLIEIMINQAILETTQNNQLITSFCSNVLSYYKDTNVVSKYK